MSLETAVPSTFVPLVPINDEETNAVKELRRLLQESPPRVSKEKTAAALSAEEITAFATDATLLRYVRAYNYSGSKAHAALTSTLCWRHTYAPSAIAASDLSDVMALGLMYVSTGVDRAGRPVIITRKNKDAMPFEAYQRNVKQVVYTLERAEKAIASHPVSDVDGKWLWIMDLREYASHNRTPLSITREVIGVLSSHYPERLHAAIFLDAPYLFRTLFWMIQPFLDAKTKAKIQFVNDRMSAESQATLHRYIAPDQCEVDMGGQQKYDAQTYMQQEKPSINAAETHSANTTTTIAHSTSSA